MMRTACLQRARSRRALASLAALATMGLAAPSLDAQASRAGKGGVPSVGVVKERGTGVLVPEASIELTRVGTTTPAAAARTDAQGAFALDAVPPGVYVIRVVRMGYRDLEDTLQVRSGPPVEITAVLTPEAIDLAPVLVSVDPETPPKMVGFERRRTRGVGTFITREDIEKSHAQRVSDLFRPVPSVRVVPAGQSGDGVLTMRGGCRPNMVIDGVLAIGGLSLDMAMTPHDVEGIEVYGSASAPIQFSHSQCGTIMVWTRAPRRVSGRGNPWKLLAILGGVIGTLIVIH